MLEPSGEEVKRSTRPEKTTGVPFDKQALWLRERDDDRIQRQDPVLIVVAVEIMAFHSLGGLFKRDDRLSRRHLPEGVGSFIEAVAGHNHLAVSDRGAPRAVQRESVRWFTENPDQQVDAIDLEGPIGSRFLAHVVLYTIIRCPREA